MEIIRKVDDMEESRKFEMTMNFDSRNCINIHYLPNGKLGLALDYGQGVCCTSAVQIICTTGIGFNIITEDDSFYKVNFDGETERTYLEKCFKYVCQHNNVDYCD